MRGLIPDSFIDDLLARVDIVDVIGQRVPLKKAGREWTACCPFHNERTPSFYVSPNKQFYHCFGCGAHGSAIKFLMDYEHLEFPDAVEELAQGVGMQVVREGGRERAPREDRTDLYQLLDTAAGQYQQALTRQPDALDYAHRRGLSDETLEAFRIGWAPAGWDFLLRRLGTTPARVKLLEQAGMLSEGERGKRYDRFRERLMFPINDRRGRVIAFGGRLVEGDGPKYLNSPETPLFHKGRELYGLWQVKQANRKLTRLVVVEGYMDVIALHQAGLPIAVATLGTATTPDHADVLFRTAPDVVFCFDGDRAGRDAAWKALESVLPKLRDGRQAYFLFLPDGEDPDSLVGKEGQAGFEQRLDQATPLSDYFFAELARDVDTRSLDGRARLAERARPLIAKLPDGAFRDLMAQELEKQTGARAVFEAAPARRQGPLQQASVKRSLVRSAIALLLAQPALAEAVEKPYAFLRFDKPGVQLLAELLDVIGQRPDIRTGALLEHFAERAEYGALQKLAVADVVGDADAQRIEFLGALEQMQRQARTQRIAALQARGAEGPLSDAEKAELRVLLSSKHADAGSAA
ncbi:DNA primase [Oleiagrimonas sp. C23AA]|uniref:DNA primase n=1 Tax=Oleiagrimonas sp. C23AA TaxID=2719047 RepID=UPI001420B33D|nr:DNA primase [Oleiagrimonas sp. C23AA]NII11381.1 DNA primase [Oleiagrimonas sp. C23AA]